MKNTVLYLTKNKKENTGKKRDYIREVASAISSKIPVQYYAIGEHTFVSDTNVLFIGYEANGKGNLPRMVRNLLKDVKPGQLQTVAIFSIAKHGGTVSALTEVKSILEPKDIIVCDEEFFCIRASAFKNKGCPTEHDLQKAAKFGITIMSKYR